MPIGDLLSYLLQDNFHKLSKVECVFLEANLFVRISDEFSEIFRNQYRNYLKLLKSEPNKEDEVIEINFLRFLVNDIVSTNEYTLEGIANFIRMPLDVILEIASGINTNPSLMLAARIIKLHSDVRRELYNDLIKKVMEESAA